MGNLGSISPDKLPLVRKLASIQCTDEEIAAGIGCSQDTFAGAWAKAGARFGCRDIGWPGQWAHELEAGAIPQGDGWQPGYAHLVGQTGLGAAGELCG